MNLPRDDELKENEEKPAVQSVVLSSFFNGQQSALSALTLPSPSPVVSQLPPAPEVKKEEIHNSPRFSTDGLNMSRLQTYGCYWNALRLVGNVPHQRCHFHLASVVHIDPAMPLRFLDILFLRPFHMLMLFSPL